MSTQVEIALAWYDDGCSIVYAREDGSKAPLDEGMLWGGYATKRASREQVEKWAATRDGIGMVCGAISGNMELFELEKQAIDEGLHLELQAKVNSVQPGLWEKINTYVELSGSGGLHWLYRCEGPVKTVKLARAPHTPTKDNDSKVATLIETKGEGGFCILAPSGGRVHPDGGKWITVIGTPGVVATITADEREILLDCAREFDRLPPPKLVDHRQALQAAPGGLLAPGQDYEARTAWPDLLEPLGWHAWQRAGDKVKWTRPGKKIGTSATTNYDGNDNLYVFSSSTEFEADASYTKFAVYALTQHDGDYAKAAKQLRKDGYGSPMPPSDQILTLIDGDGEGEDDDPETEGEESSSVTTVTVTLTDDGNAQRLVMLERHRLRYIPDRGQWLEWTRSRWEWEPDRGAAVQAMRDIIRDIKPVTDVVRKHREKSLSARAIMAAVGLAEMDPGIRTRIEELDSDPYALNTPGGVVNLLTSELAAPTPEALHTRMTSVAPDFDRVPERWLQFLAETMLGAREPGKMIPFLQRLAGYSATGKVTHHVLPFLHGSGGNGKTVFLEVLQAVLGDYSGAAPADFLLASGKDELNAVATLSGQRLVVCSEVPQTAKFNETKVKNLTGGDRLAARFMRENMFTFTPTHHLWLLGNHQPRVDAGGTSFFRRLRLIPFLHEVPEDEQIEGLADQLVAEEGPGILAWVIRGAKLQFDGLKEPAEVLAATQEYAEEEDHLGRFLGERVKLGGDPKLVRVNTKDMRHAYEVWCFSEGIKTPLPVSPFGRELKTRGIEKKSSNGQNYYTSVTLLNPDPDPSELIDRPHQESWYDR